MRIPEMLNFVQEESGIPVNYSQGICQYLHKE